MTLQPTAVDRRAILRRVFGILAAIFLLIGTFGLAAAGVLAFMESSSGRTARADGVIQTGDYQALVQFTTAGGQTVQFRNWVNSTSNHAGDHVPVAYDPANPQGAEVDAFAGRWFLAMLFAIIASPFFLLGVAFAVTFWMVGRRGSDAGL